MPNRPMRAVWMTLLVYALAGPLVGLLAVLVIDFLTVPWEAATDRLRALLSEAQNPACASLPSGHFDSLCFQRFEPRQIGFPPLGRVPVYIFGAYIIGIMPALLAGAFICARGLRDGVVSFGYAAMVGTLVGLVMGGAMAMYKPENASLFFICLIATIVCWRITERFWRRADIVELARADGTRQG